MKIVSGGQTGVDRAALDAALALGIDAGGWCPRGRLAEDGPIPLCYPVTEMPGTGYAQRTRQNVIDSDATSIICFGAPGGGTGYTLDCCVELQKPYLLIDAEVSTIADAALSLKDFIIRFEVAVLNVAGPRASESVAAYEYTRAVLSEVLRGV